jgi:hypothetical protein
MEQKGMKKLSFVLLALLTCPSYATVYDLDVAMNNVRNACSGINSKMDHLKLMAGINTGIGAVGTVTGAVALGTGIAKDEVDQDYEKLKAKIAEKIKADTNPEVHYLVDRDKFYKQIDDFLKSHTDKVKDVKTESTKLKELEDKSKTLGNVRTGMLAVNTATSVAGAVISSQNKATGSIKEAIDNCISATDDLRESMMQARMDGRDTVAAKRIVDACSEYKSADLSKIDKLATGSTVSSSIGAVAGGVGMITSIAANTDSTRKDDSKDGKAKEKNLNTASNVLSGVTTATSAVSTVLNGVQIATIKKVVSISEKCEKEIQ